MKHSKVQLVSAVVAVGLLAVCAHAPQPSPKPSPAARPQASLASLMAAGAGRAALLVLLHPDKLATSRALVLQMLAGLNPPPSIVAAVESGDGSRVIGALVATLASNGQTAPARLDGLDVTRPVLLALAEPVGSSPIAGAIETSLGDRRFPLRHRIVLPATDSSRLLGAVDTLLSQRRPDKAGAHVFAPTHGIETVAATVATDSVVLTFLGPTLTQTGEISFDSAPDSAAPESQVRQALLAPVAPAPDLSAPALRALGAPGEVAALAVRMELVGSALLTWDAAMLRSVMPMVSAEHRKRIAAQAFYESLLGWVIASPDAIEVPTLSFSLALAPVLRLRAAASLSDLGQRAFSAAVRQSPPGLPIIKDALWSTTVHLDVEALTAAVPDLLPGRGASERDLLRQLLSGPRGLLSLASRPAAWVREVKRGLAMRHGAPRGVSVSLADLRPDSHGPRFVGSLTLVSPAGSDDRQVRRFLGNLAAGLNRAGNDARVTTNAALDVAGQPLLHNLAVGLDSGSSDNSETPKDEPGTLARVSAQPANLARRLTAMGKAGPLLALSERFDTLHASWRLYGNQLIGELTAAPAGVSDDAPPFTPQPGSAQTVVPGVGAECLRRAIVALRPAFAAAAIVEQQAMRAVLAGARRQVQEPLSCAAHDPATRDDVKAIARLLDYLGGTSE